jgi:hypothetical protein
MRDGHLLPWALLVEQLFLALFCSKLGGSTASGEGQFNTFKPWTSTAVSKERLLGLSLGNDPAKIDNYNKGTPSRHWRLRQRRTPIEYFCAL